MHLKKILLVIGFFLVILFAYGTYKLIEANNFKKETANCPEFVDCMPCIGDSCSATRCQIPKGCEGVTGKVY